MNPKERILDAFSRTTQEILSLEEFKKKLDSGKKLKIKFGADVTAPFLHIGHAVNLWMMRYMQEFGHKVQFLVGDFTTRIGDPTGRSESRKEISKDDIEINAQRFIQQISNILITDDPEVFEVRRNSEFYREMPIDFFMELLASVTHSRLISRDMFKARIAAGQEIHMHEIVYPIIQGYDSVALESDLTIVGTDQLFNEMMGRFYQEKYDQEPQVVITTKITAGLDGKQKQSKSLNNYVAITDSSKDQFGKIMGLPDELIPDWMRIYTCMDLDHIDAVESGLKSGQIHPRDAKLELAGSVVERYYGQSAAAAEKNWFLQTFSKRAFPEDAPEHNIPPGDFPVFQLMQTLLKGTSNSEIRRLITQGGVKIDGQQFQSVDDCVQIKAGQALECQVGKRRFFKLNGGR